MGTILASKIIADAAKVMLDPDYVRNSTSDWLKWLNAGQNQIVFFKPDISVQTSSVVQVAGTKQTLEAGDISLIKITRNMGTDGATPGTVIELVNEDQMNLQNPDWHFATADNEAVCYVFDERDPKSYYVYPPQPSSSPGYIERVVCVTPTTIADIGDPITVDDINEDSLFNYIMYRANTVNANQSIYAQTEATKYYNTLVSGLGRKDLIEKDNAPKAKGIKNGQS